MKPIQFGKDFTKIIAINSEFYTPIIIILSGTQYIVSIHINLI